MARTRTALAASAALAVTLGVCAGPAHAAAAAPAAPAAPKATTSLYVTLAGKSTKTAGESAHTAGCAQGRTGRSGVRVLFLGTQQGADRLRPPGTSAKSTKHAPASLVPVVAKHFTAGFAKCRTGGATATLALGVNNKQDGGAKAATAGAQWARTVQSAAKSATKTVRVTAAIDAEPRWSSPAWARAWVKSFTDATSTPLYAANSADGCPSSPKGANTCANKWTLADVHYVSTGAARTVHALPQIYRTDGIQARQWATISTWGARNGSGPLRFAGSMSQHGACGQRSGCGRTNNTPAKAWKQLYDALNSRAETRPVRLPTATDIRWL
ncbi:hypothetical protein CLV63_116168 [Murinocardiopsis flavida]|uniref:Uncharacterized protein n=1 Tax=Murinocardiopsis flavida TaxID=645275 RepID=A0A2P8D9A5_9ACTN|nr:hypothetical protein [Murinocardiopsis flavida]PSK93761.1 hypothetical protein CLV63_116168 [Murinocardiopsis flavida]